MATLRDNRKLAAVTRETQEEHPRNGQSLNTSVPRIKEEYITQVSEEIEGRVTKNCSRSSAGRSPAFWVLCLKKGTFSWTHRYEHTPEPFREHSRTQTWKARSQWGSFSRWSSSWNGNFRLTVPSFNWVRPRRNPSHQYDSTYSWHWK